MHTFTFSIKIGENAYASGTYHVTNTMDEYNDSVEDYCSSLEISGTGEIDLSLEEEYEHTYYSEGETKTVTLSWYKVWNVCIAHTVDVSGVTNIPDRFFQRSYGDVIDSTYYKTRRQNNRVNIININSSITSIGWIAFSTQITRDVVFTTLPLDIYLQGVFGDSEVYSEGGEHGLVKKRCSDFWGTHWVETIAQYGVKEMNNGYIAVIIYKGDKLHTINFTDPTKIEFINNNAFDGCCRLSQIDFGNHTPEVIGDYLFKSCFSISNVHLDKNLIPTVKMFSDCVNLETFNQDNSIISYEGVLYDKPNMQFNNCVSLKFITLPEEFKPNNELSWLNWYTTKIFCVPKYVCFDIDENGYAYLDIYGTSAFPCCRRWRALDNRRVRYEVNDFQYAGRLTLILSHRHKYYIINCHPRPFDDKELDKYLPVIHRNRTWYVATGANGDFDYRYSYSTPLIVLDTDEDSRSPYEDDKTIIATNTYYNMLGNNPREHDDDDED